MSKRHNFVVENPEKIAKKYHGMTFDFLWLKFFKINNV